MSDNPRNLDRNRALYSRKNGKGGNGSKDLNPTPSSGAKQIYISGAPTIPARDASENGLIREENKVPKAQDARTNPTSRSSGDLADHFLNCAKLSA